MSYGKCDNKNDGINLFNKRNQYRNQGINTLILEDQVLSYQVETLALDSIQLC